MNHHDIADKMADRPVTRTEYGSGSLYQRTSDWRWMGAVKAGYTASGTRRRVSVTGKGCVGGCAKKCPHRAAIKRKLRDKLIELDAAGHHNVKRTTSVAKWSTAWLANIQPKVRPSAYETDRAAVRAIVAAIGEVRLTDLTPDDIRKVARRLRSKGMSTSTALRYHGSLIRLLKAAAIEGYSIPPNVLLVDNPKAAVNDREAVILPDAIKVLGRVSNSTLVPDGSRWALAFLQGLRQAEALGLTWNAVDLERRTLTISWQVKSLRYLDRSRPELGFAMPDGYEARHLIGSTHLVRPKSTAGWRVQPLVPWAVNSLRDWREASPPNPHNLVWPGRTNKGGTWPRNPASDREQWEAIQEAVDVKHSTGRPYHVHEIRHGTATLLLALKVPESVRVAIMGHSTHASTRGYEHVDLTQARDALDAMAEALGLSPQAGASATPALLGEGAVAVTEG